MFVELDFFVAFAVTFVAVILLAADFVRTALVGTAFFGRAPFLAAEVAFFTAMLGSFKMALRRPRETHTRVREDKAIGRSSQWRNAALVSVSPQQIPAPSMTGWSR
jgi:Na+/H+-translocating membrane pyrophosphatase